MSKSSYIPGENDSHPDDNSAAILVNIYYANNGDRAFRPGKDGYSFGNYNFSGRETEELIEGFLATLVGNLQPEQIDQIAQAIEIRKTLAATAGAALGSGGGLKAEQALVERIVFAPTYVLMDDYLNRSMRAGAGGHCYGMSATSALYFEDPGQKPVEKDVGERSLEEASQNIDIYVRAWFLPLFAALQSDMIVPRLNMGAQQCHQALKSSLQQDRKALIVEVYGSDGGRKTGHAVLGYKMIEVEGRPSVVYVYDPNYPAARIKPPLPMSQIYLWLQENNWGNPPYMGYQWTDRRITADRVHREVSLEDANAILPGLKKSITDLSSVLHSLGKALIVVRCPAEAVFTDSSGKSTGNQSGQLINAIEGAEVLSMGEVEIYRLPLGGRYEVAISGTGSGTLGFDVIAPENQTGLGLVSFQEIALSKGSSITGTLEAGDIDVLKTSSGDVLPSLEGYVDAGVSQPPQQIEAGADNGSESLAGNISSPAGDAVEKSIQDLQNPNVSIRREAAAALFDPKDPRAVEPLIQDLDDPDPEVRERAASALGWIGDLRAVEPLIEMLGDEDNVVRSITAISLGVLNDSRAVDPLIQALGDVNSSVRANAAVSLGGYLKDSRAVQPLIRTLEDPESVVRSSSAYAIGELGDQRAEAPLTRALNDEEATVREEAAVALQKLASKEGVEEPLKPVSNTSQTPIGETELGPAGSIFSSQKIDDYKGGTASPDGTRIAYSQAAEGGSRYVVAGPEGKINGSVYESIRDFVFSPDGRHYAYKALIGDKRVAVMDGSEGQGYDEIYKIVFSSEGRRYAYMADKGGKVVVVVDGREVGPYDGTSGDPIIGQHVAYTIVKDGNNHVVLDGEIQEKVGYEPVFSPDGSRWAYSRSATYVGDPCYIVLDGEVTDLGNDNRVGGLTFSSDGKRFAYDLVPGGGAYGRHLAVVDGVSGKEYPFPGVGKIVFSPDGRRVAYWAKAEGQGFMMVLDGKEGQIYEEMQDPIFSPDGNHVAYVAADGKSKFVVLDGKDGTRYGDIWGLTFSIDGRLAYVAKDSREGEDVRLVVVDGQEERAYGYDWYGQGIRSGPVFSPGGGHVVYVANDGGKAEFVVVDGVRHLHPWTFLGGLNWGEGSPIIFDSEEKLHYLATNETGTYIVKARVPSAVSPPDKCAWTGIWDTNLGIMDLEQSGETASGLMLNAYWLGWIQADETSKKLAGIIARSPTYKPPDVDSFEINMSEDCQSFTGHSRNGLEGPWSFEWIGTRS